ncbi:phosphoribosylglycinamide formyltransferase [Alkalidesulfovibrio alkalitolerans DSM 16529]|jgi:phosphoribosylglycinamide formyltransferase-1|uniref:Phosphoribosylglycinamide formyltransferase n=1 Tax=Alkalidesulfovibrio alkalitolerans DSM 16529 TaxID=1121439 RepID=S7T8D0_9BACT|nr:phosphoribosylglycinamide formyltransferase [Alkalidesulfovibrio alkalitolerans]EPR32821.1 phosphoribosylglycinamide formyltransferase [Alkalidesulfovibrio alkalitolerans DSM 16529]
MTLDLAVLVSGSGSNLQAVIDRIESGALDARLRLVLSNKPQAYGLERARKHGVPALCLEHGSFPDREAFDAEMVRLIREHGADTVAMAGFMRMVTPRFLSAFPGRVVNIHPALLPSFPGVHGQRDAADYGVRFSGCTVHFVDEKMDNGPIIIQAVVPAYPGDDGKSLGARILELEHRIYPQALQWLAQGRLTVSGRKVLLANEGQAPTVALPSGAMVNPPLEPGF